MVRWLLREGCVMLVYKIKAIAPQIEESDFLSKVVLQDDGNGAYIAKWGIGIPRPTDKEISDAKAVPAVPQSPDPLAKLVDFLKANPDVLDLVTKVIQVEGKAK